MTRTEIHALPAGRELDVLVARKVMDDLDEDGEWLSVNGSKFWHKDGGPKEYSTDIKAAWEVVERLTLHRFGFVLTQWAEGGDVFAKFTKSYREYVAEASFGQAPLAICLAALMTQEGQP